MLYGTDRKQMREIFFRAWRKQAENRSLEGIEQVVVEVAVRHPEYHKVLENPEAYEERDFQTETGQTNPFLHMGLHIAIQEQISTDRPSGVVACFKVLLTRLGDPHEAEHHMMDCLAESLQEAQRLAREPSEDDYLERLMRRAEFH